MSIRLIQFTDPHLYADPDREKRGLNTRQSFRQVVGSARRDRWPPDALVVTGDIAEDESAGAYQAFRDVLAGDDSPVLCLPGNHDDPRLMQMLLNDHRFRYLGAHVFGSWLLVLLDSRLEGEVAGALTEVQTEALDRLLARHPQHHALVCLHHPPIAMDSVWIDGIGLRQPEGFLEVLERHPTVRGVLWGHVHQERDSVHNGIRMMSTPSTGSQFTPRVDEFSIDPRPPGYRWLELQPDGRIDTDVVRVTLTPATEDPE